MSAAQAANDAEQIAAFVAWYTARPMNDVEDTARFLGMGINQAYGAIKRGELPSLRLGGRIRVPTKQLLALIEGR